MSAYYALTLHNHLGERIAEIDAYEQLQYTLKQNDISGLMLLVNERLYPQTLFQEDYTLRVYRNGQLEGQTAFFIRKVRDGKLGGLQVEAFSAVHLLWRRTVAYASGTPFTDKNGPADDVIKEIVRENLGATATDPLRRLTDHLTIAEDSGQGATVFRAFSRRNVLEVLKDIALDSAQLGTWLGFDVALNVGSGLYFFQTYTGRRGTDRRFSSNNPTLFPITALSDDSYQETDYTQEATYIYALGKGEGVDRIVKVAFDQARINASPFNRIEVSHNATQGETEDYLQGEANSRLEEGRPAFRFVANLLQVAGVEYGVDYLMGDLVTVEYKGRQYDCRIGAIAVDARVNTETIQTVLENV